MREAASEFESTSTGYAIQPYQDLPTLHFSVSGEVELVASPHWFLDVDLPRDRERGYPAREDHFGPGVLRIPLLHDTPLVVAASIDGPIEDPIATWSTESRRRTKRLKSLGVGDDPGPVERLRAAADDFLMEDGSRLGIDASRGSRTTSSTGSGSSTTPVSPTA